MARRAATLRQKALSLTSLIDVIFLLLLFFMLTTTFTRTGDVPFSTQSQSGGAGAPSTDRPIFVQLGADTLSINGQPVPVAEAVARIAELAPKEAAIVINTQPGVTAQRLTEVLVTLGTIAGARLHILG